MAHNLNLIAKQVNIYFEREGKVWHGVGQIVEDYPTSAEAIRHAGLNYEIENSKFRIGRMMFLKNISS